MRRNGYDNSKIKYTPQNVRFGNFLFFKHLRALDSNKQDITSHRRVLPITSRRVLYRAKCGFNNDEFFKYLNYKVRSDHFVLDGKPPYFRDIYKTMKVNFAEDMSMSNQCNIHPIGTCYSGELSRQLLSGVIAFKVILMSIPSSSSRNTTRQKSRNKKAHCARNMLVDYAKHMKYCSVCYMFGFEDPESDVVHTPDKCVIFARFRTDKNAGPNADWYQEFNKVEIYSRSSQWSYQEV